MALEVELKLAVAARDVARVLRHPAVTGAMREALAPVRLLSIYYDTPGFDLWERAVAVRLRREGDGWIQTVKWAGSAAGGLHMRGELEKRVPAQSIDANQFQDEPLAGVLPGAGVLRRLRPAFVTEFQRTVRVLDLEPGAVIELCADRGSVVAGTAREPICEIELELRSGPPVALYRLARALEADIPLRPLVRSKAERGYRLAGIAAGPVKAQPVRMPAEATIGQALGAVLASGLEQLQSNEAGLLAGDDPEYLHQQRVAVRRMRSALSAFRPVLEAGRIAPVAAELKWLGGRLGPARDLDVFVTELLPPLLARVGRSEALEAIVARAQALREQANRAARAAVRSRRYARLLLTLGQLLVEDGWRVPPAVPGLPEPGAGAFSAGMLARRHRKALKLGKGIDAASLPRLHELRIALKKLRYAGEFFADLHPGARARGFRERLVHLQDALGRISDAGTMQALVERRLTDDPVTRALVAGWAAGMVHAELARVKPLFREFRRARPYW